MKITNYKRGTEIKPRPNRTEAQIEADLPHVAELYLKGYPISRIAKEMAELRDYTYTHYMVRADVQRIRTFWLESALVNYNEAKGRELARIDMLETAAWEEFERSKKDKETTEIVEETGGDPNRKRGDAEMDQMFSRTIRKAKREGRDGSTDFLKIVQWCIEQRLKIFGLYAPQQLSVTWRQEIEKEGLDPDMIIDALARDIESALAKGAKPNVIEGAVSEDEI